MLSLSPHLKLANFLESLATIGVSSEEWQQYLVTHYPDARLEKARILVVRLTLNYSFDEKEFSHGRLRLQSTDTELSCQIKTVAFELLN